MFTAWNDLLLLPLAAIIIFLFWLFFLFLFLFFLFSFFLFSTFLSTSECFVSFFW